MKDSKEKISEPCFFRVSNNQMKHIKECFQQSGMKSFSAFLRQQVVHGIYLEFNKAELETIRKAVQTASSDINYITVRVNSIKRIYDNDFVDLREQLNTIQQQLQYILSILQKLKPYIKMKSRRLTNNDDDKISEPCFFRVSPNQMNVIEERFKQSGMKSFSAFLRQQVVFGLQLQFDNEEYMLIQRAIQKSAVNLNQIESFVINFGMFYTSIMNELKDMMDEIWHIQRDIQALLIDVGAISF